MNDRISAKTRPIELRPALLIKRENCDLLRRRVEMEGVISFPLIDSNMKSIVYQICIILPSLDFGIPLITRIIQINYKRYSIAILDIQPLIYESHGRNLLLSLPT